MTPVVDCVAPLFVPGHRPERFEKAAASGADAIVIDLEDAVPAELKASARSAVRADFTDLPVFVRVNALTTPWHKDDIVAISGLPIAGIIVPKAELGSGLENVGVSSTRKMAVVALIESARGLADARAIAGLTNVIRLAFGSIDFCADLGCSHVRESLLLARSELVLASRLAGKPAPLDGVSTSMDDIASIEEDARYAFQLGFGGKLCIHPAQVGPVLKGGKPTDAEVAWAHRILASGDGAVAVEGSMVDEPVRAHARALLKRV